MLRLAMIMTAYSSETSYEVVCLYDPRSIKTQEQCCREGACNLGKWIGTSLFWNSKFTSREKGGKKKQCLLGASTMTGQI